MTDNLRELFNEYVELARHEIITTYKTNRNPITACLALSDDWRVKMGAAFWLELLFKEGDILDVRSTMLTVRSLAKREKNEHVAKVLSGLAEIMESK